MLLGIELWRYAKRREIEDMENGIIPWHDIYPDRPGDEILDRKKIPGIPSIYNPNIDSAEKAPDVIRPSCPGPKPWPKTS
jgi:hypothetical protein